MKIKSIFLLVMTISLLSSITYIEHNPNDERFKVIALQKARIRLDRSEYQYENAKTLYENRLISFDEYERYRVQFDYEKLNYQQYMLNVIFDKPHFTIIEALKNQNFAGQIFVDLTIKNSSGGAFGLEEMLLDLGQDMNLSPTSMYNIYVSLLDDKGNIISQPYEHNILKLDLEEEYKITFELLKDVDYLSVAANYGDRREVKRIYLKRGGDIDSVSMTPDIFTQETESGSVASYRLNVEYYGQTRQRYSFDLNGLPPQFSYEFVNLNTNSVVSNIMLSPQNPVQNFLFRVRVPDKIEQNITLDQEIFFEIRLKNTYDELVSSLDLGITPTGRTRLSLIMQNMYFLSDIGEFIEIYPVTVKNDGMRSLRDVSFDLVLPIGWEYQIKPEKIDILEPNTELKVDLKLKHADNVLPGIYQVKLRATSKYVNRTINSEERDLRIELKNKANIFGIIILFILALAFLIFIVWIILKISKN